MRLVAVGLLVSLLTTGCAETVVRRVTNEKQKGVRFYRSKPYLKLAAVDGRPDYVTISIEHLPDFAEEYAIRPITGIGENDTEIVLNDNGTLKSIHSKTNADFAANVNALANLVKAIPLPAAPKATADEIPKQASEPVMIPAYRVPLGYYESVVSRGDDCVKRLYAWRCVGFAPFASCPIESIGVNYRHCDEPLYGLVNIGNRTVFASLNDLATKPQMLNEDPTVNIHEPLLPPAPASGFTVDEVNTKLKTVKANFALKEGDLHFDVDMTNATVTITVKKGIMPPLDTKQIDVLKEACKSVVVDKIPGGKVVFN